MAANNARNHTSVSRPVCVTMFLPIFFAEKIFVKSYYKLNAVSTMYVYTRSTAAGYRNYVIPLPQGIHDACRANE
jgi:hypothetical protein